MKAKKSFNLLSLLISLIIIILFSLVDCSKSSKSAGSSSSSSGGGNGLMITITGLPEWNDGQNLYIILKEREDKDPVAYANGEIYNGQAEMYLYDFMKDDKPWTKTGNYYIGVSLPDEYDFTYVRYDLKRGDNGFDFDESTGNSVSAARVERNKGIFKGQGEGWIPAAIWKEFGLSSGLPKPQGVKARYTNEEGSVETFMEHTEEDGKWVGYQYTRSSWGLSLYMDEADESIWTSIHDQILAQLPDWSEDENRNSGDGRSRYSVFSGTYVFNGMTFGLSCSYSGSGPSVSINIRVNPKEGEIITPTWPINEFFSNLGLSGITQPDGTEVTMRRGYFGSENESGASYEIFLSGGNESGFNRLRDQIADRVKVTPYINEGHSERSSSVVFEREDLKVEVFHSYGDKKPVKLEIRW